MSWRERALVLEGIPRIPRIPREILERHHAFVSTDAAFVAAARLLQSLWREAEGLPVGEHRGRRLGSYLAVDDGDRGANFLTPELATLVRRELVFLERGIRVDRDRLFRNLLTSQALCFNLFGSLKLAPEVAQRFFARLAPDLVDAVTDLVFEHAPGRSRPDLTGDRTAFDAFARARDADGRPTFLSFEVKYVEQMQEDATTTRVRLDALATTSKLFRDPDAPTLRAAPLQQLWREHVLSASLVGDGHPYHKGRFIFIAPRLNAACWEAVRAYQQHLISSDPGDTGFQAIALEDCLDLLTDAGAVDAAAALRARYLDFDRIVDLIANSI